MYDQKNLDSCQLQQKICYSCKNFSLKSIVFENSLSKIEQCDVDDIDGTLAVAIWAICNQIS